MLKVKDMEQRMERARSEFRSLLDSTGIMVKRGIKDLSLIKSWLAIEIEDYSDEFEYSTLQENLSEELQDWTRENGLAWGA